MANEKQLTPIDGFLSLEPYQQKILAVSVLSGLELDDEELPDTISNKSIVGDQSFSYYELSNFRSKLAKLKLTIPYERLLRPEVKHTIAEYITTPGWPFLTDVLTTLLGKTKLALPNYRAKAVPEPAMAIRLGLYLNDPAPFAFDPNRSPIRYNSDVGHVQAVLYDITLDLGWLASRHPVIQAYICVAKLLFIIAEQDKRPTDRIAIYKVYQSLPHATLKHDYLYYLMIQIDIGFGDLSAATDKLAMLSNNGSSYTWLSQSLLAFFQNDSHRSQAILDTHVDAIKKQYKKRNFCYHDLVGMFYFFQKIHQGQAPELAQFEMNFYEKHGMPLGFNMLKCIELLRLFALLALGDKDAADAKLRLHFTVKPTQPLVRLFYELLQYAINTKVSPKRLEALEKLMANYKSYHFALAEHVIAEIILSAKPKHEKAAACLAQSPITIRFLSMLQAKAPWEYHLLKLESLLLPEAEQKTTAIRKVALPTKRLVWLLNPDTKQIAVLEQSSRKDGTWSAGRAIALQKLYESKESYPYLTEQDKRALEGLRHEYNGWYSSRDDYYFDKDETLLELVGHPAIYHLQHRQMRIELERGEPYLCIAQKGKTYRLQLSHQLDETGVILEAVGINHYKVIDSSHAYREIQTIIGKKGTAFPAPAKDRILHLLQHTKPDIKIQADMEETNLPTIEANSAPCLQLFPDKEAIQIKGWVRPFTDVGPYARPGEGASAFIAAISEEGGEHIRKKAVRNLEEEQTQYQTLLSACPTLSQYDDGSLNYCIDDKDEILECISELEAYHETSPLTIEWPKGETYKIKKLVSGKDVSLSIKSGQSWFKYEGEVTVDDETVMDMRLLLDAVSHSQSRFIPLKEGGFLALTHKLKKQLLTLQTLSDDQTLSTLGANLLSDLAQDAGHVEADEAWKAHLKAQNRMRNHTPKIPSTLQAQLRDYQEDGFRYLSRLVNWGIGACLADDMGLGKTIQAITLLLEQASKGPALVIAPKSVSFNWVAELAKFAPSLNVQTLSNQINRAQLIKKLGKLDVLICSYGLLQHNQALLIDKNWHTVILDEAQAIKNHATKRWKAVTSLQAKNRIALTGTPIENHLGEVWSIFHFLNPGLLGNRKRFEQRFAIPIEQHHNQSVKQALKTLISPFILRRIKTDVLDDLPPKIEQTVVIEPSQEETAFYEALRRKAVETISTFDGKDRRFKMMVEINRLRQACCHPGLVKADLDIESSKLEYLSELVLNLKENNHKALIFSQYVRYFDLVRPMLDKLNLHYHYLDGSTSLAKRKASVEAFQGGDGDLFLLSLKAGGSGLNLTAADFVIHLDPWWNPAVEDQASDRAHRIGQDRPVTIYRLVMKNSIEEKIIAMHKDKRELATELLSDQSKVGKLSEDDLMDLIAA